MYWNWKSLVYASTIQRSTTRTMRARAKARSLEAENHKGCRNRSADLDAPLCRQKRRKRTRWQPQNCVGETPDMNATAIHEKRRDSTTKIVSKAAVGIYPEKRKESSIHSEYSSCTSHKWKRIFYLKASFLCFLNETATTAAWRPGERSSEGHVLDKEDALHLNTWVA